MVQQQKIDRTQMDFSTTPVCCSPGVTKSQTQLRETTITPLLREIRQRLYLVACNCKNLGIKKRETAS